jgi:DNA polymerase-3 subunit epsilon
MKITCIDFETANSSRGSACSVGVAVIIDGEITATAERLIKPHPTCSYFDPFNIDIHGIRPRDVASSPDFKARSPWLFELLNADMVVAHNAAFDMSVLRAVCDLYRLPYPEFEYFCTSKAAAQCWRHLENHKLNTLCDYIGHKFRHHNAEADAEAAGRVLLTMLAEAEMSCPKTMAGHLDLKLGRLTAGGYKPCSCKRPRKNTYSKKMGI